MKTFNGILGLFLVVGLFLTPAPVQADYSLQDAVDIVLTAVGSQSVDPGLSTALGAAPGAIKSGLLFKCNQNRQRINLELTNHPPNSMQLIEESNRNQAIISAIYGDPGPLRKLIKERNKKIADQKKKKKAEERAEEKDSMEFQLDQYQKKIDQLKALKDQILKDGRFALGMVESSLRDAKDIQDELNQYVFFISSLTDRGEKLCVEARLLRQKMIALAVAVADGEALVNTKVNLAKGRKANCKTAEDGLFVKNNYLAAQKALATIKKAKEAAFEYLLEINIKLEPIKKINKQLSNHDSHKWQELRQKQNNYLKQVPQYLDKLETGLKEAKGFPVKVQELKLIIEDSKKYYIQYFPKATDDYDRLISELSFMELTYVTGPAWLSDLQDKYHREEMAQGSFPINSTRGFRGTLPSINCISNKAIKTVMDEINEAFFRTVLVIKANQYLSNGCQPSSSVPPITVPEETIDLPSGGGVVPNIPPVATTSSNPPVKSTFGGLFIAGPTQITVGQGVSYVACDGDGQPYTTGSFSWNHSREDILVLPRSGNPVAGTAFKPGKVTMFVKYEGMTAYLDIEIKAKEENLFSSSGGEEDTDNNLFSSSGGEESDSVAEVQLNNQFQQKCNELVDLTVWSLNRHDADSAQSYTNQAVALGCDINTAKVDQVVAQIHDIEKAEEQRREREKQQQEQQQTVPPQPQNQANWGNVMNLLVQGMQNIQQENNNHSRKPSRGSNPLPTADSIWPSHQTESGSSGGSRNSSQNSGNSSSKKPSLCGHWTMILKVVSNSDSSKGAEKVGSTIFRSVDVSAFRNSLYFDTTLSANTVPVTGEHFHKPLTYADSISLTHKWNVDEAYATRQKLLKLSLSGNRLTGSLVVSRFYDKSGEHISTIKYSIRGTKKKN